MSSKRVFGWIGVSILALILVVMVAGFFFLRSQMFHKFVISKAEQQAGQSLGTQVRIQNIVLHIKALTADAYGITIAGKGPEAQPLAQADQLTIRLKIVSLLHKKIDLREIILKHPVVNFRVDKNGDTNLPTPPKSKSNSSTNPFDLGIKHVLISNGDVYYNDVKTPLDADLHDFQLELTAPLGSKNYDGMLSYRDGRLKYGAYQPLPHAVNASFTVTPSQFQLKPLLLTVASSTVELQGKVDNYSQPSIEGNYRIVVHPQDFRAAMKNPQIPRGEMLLVGSLKYQYQQNASLVQTAYVDGKLSSRELLLDTSSVRGAIRNLGAEFKLTNGNLDAHAIVADLLGGHLKASARMQHLDANPAGEVRASVTGVSMGAAKSAMPSANSQQLPLQGTVSGDLNAAWIGTVQNVKAATNFVLNGTLASAHNGRRVPLNGEFHVTYDGRSQTATLANTFVRTPQTTIDANGSAGRKLNVNLQLHARDLRELDSVAAALSSGGKPDAAKSLNLAGNADARIAVQGAVNDPRIHGQLNGHDLQLQDTRWKTWGFGFSASKNGASIQNGSLVNAQQGYANFSALVTLSNWHYAQSNPIQANVSSRGLAIQQLLHVAKLNYPVSGNLAVDLSLKGSQLNPAGNGSVRLLQAKVYGQPMQQLSLQFNGNGDSINSSLNVSTTAGSAKLNLTVNPKSKAYEIHLDAPGVKLGQLYPVQQKNLGIAGTFTATASGRGTLNDPQLTASVQIPQLQTREATIGGIRADLSVANRKAHLTLASEVVQTAVNAQATMDLTGAYFTRATFDTKQIPIEALVALVSGPARSNGPRGILEVHGSAEGPLKEMARMQAQISIPTLKANYQGLEIGNTKPIRAHYANYIAYIDSAEIAGTDTNLRLQGQLPVKGNAPVTLAANGSVDMQLLRFFNPDIQSSGKLLLDAKATGAAGHPQVAGQVKLQAVNLMMPDAPVGLENLNGALDVNNDRVIIRQLTGQSGGGQISATGMVAYRPTMQANVALKANNVRIRYQDEIRTLLDGDISLVGTSEAANVTGRVLINSLSFTPNFDLASLAGSVESGPESMPSQGIAQNIKLNIAVETSRDLNAQSSQVSLQGSANLRVIGTAADPVIIGRTQFTGGDIFLMNKRYTIERGIIEFSNPNRTEPVLNVVLTTTINQYNLSLTFLGPLDKMQTNYVSDPALPTADIVSLIARGQTTEQATAAPSGMGASGLLAKGAVSQVSGSIQKLAGLSTLSIDPTSGCNNTDPGTCIEFQKRLTGALLFTFGTDVTQPQREVIQGEYQFNKRWSATITRNENGGFAVDGKYHRRY